MGEDRETGDEMTHEREGGTGTPDTPAVEDMTEGTTSSDSSEGDKELTEMSKEFDEIVSSTSDASTHVSKPVDEAQKPTEPASHKSLLSGNLNKYFLYTLVGGLVVSALISVFAVLAGEFNSTLVRALGTTASMVVHTLLLLLLVSLNKKRGNKSGEFLMNTLLIITVASFITSILATWEVISGRIVADLYQVYFYSFCAALWSQLMFSIGSNLLDKPTRIASLISVGFTAILYLQALPTIFTQYPALTEFYYRGIAAVAILLATSSILTIVFHRIYTFKHPEIKPTNPRGTVWNIIVACIFLFFGLPLIFTLIGMLSTLGSRIQTDTSTPHQTKLSPSPYVNPQPQSTPDTKTYSYDSEALSEALNRQYNTQKTCINAANQTIPDSKIEIFASLESGIGTRLVTKPLRSPSATQSSPIYPETVFRDKNCHRITGSSLKQGDRLYFYYAYNPETMPPYKLSIVQKLD